MKIMTPGLFSSQRVFGASTTQFLSAEFVGSIPRGDAGRLTNAPLKITSSSSQHHQYQPAIYSESVTGINRIRFVCCERNSVPQKKERMSHHRDFNTSYLRTLSFGNK